MAQIAPEERITIRYTPHHSNTSQELPLKLLIIGGFKGNSHPEVDIPVGMRTPAAIDHTTFDNVMAAATIRLTTRIDHYTPLSALYSKQAQQPLDINLQFEGLKDFTPDKLIQQIPELRTQAMLRELLTTLKNSYSRKKERQILKAIITLLIHDIAKDAQ